MKVSQHITELKQTLKRIGIVIGIILLFTMIISRPLLKIYITYFNINVYAFNPLEELQILMLFSLALTIILSSGYIIYELYKFIKPAYTINNSIKIIGGVLTLALIMFGIGSTIGAKYLLANLEQMTLFTNMWSITSVLKISFMLGTALAIAVFIAYLIPILIKIGIIQQQTLTKSRKYVFLSFFLISATVTPTDILSTIMVFTPLYISFESGNLISKFYGGKQNGMGNTRNSNSSSNSSNVIRCT